MSASIKMWIWRAAFALVALAFGYEGLKVGFDPTSIARLGWQLNGDVAASTVRAGLGGHWLAVAAIVVFGFLTPRWRVSCFAFATMWTTMIAIGRAAGAAVDGLDALQTSQLIQECFAATVALVGFWAAAQGDPRRVGTPPFSP
jgi:hypothetical protein